MSSFGVLSTGFNPKLITDILSDIETRQKADFGAQINTGGESVLGQNNATFAASLAEAWEVLGAVYRSLYPDSALDEALDNVAAITGVSREPATKSTMTVTCSGASGTLLLAGRVVSTAGAGDRFVSLADAVIGGGGTVDVAFEAEEFGPVTGLAGTLTIETPVAGWASAANALDADEGQNLETNAELRLRREQLIRSQGSNSLEAIRASVLSVEDVSQAFVFENVSIFVDSRGLPGKSFEVIVQGGTDAAVAQAIFDRKPAGAETYGAPGLIVTETITDSQGTSHDINFTRPDEIDLYITLTVNIRATDYPTDGDDQLKLAFVALVDSLIVGDTVIYERLQAEVFTVSGVVDSPVFFLGTSPSPTGTSNIPITERELAVIDSSDILVSTVAV